MPSMYAPIIAGIKDRARKALGKLKEVSHKVLGSGVFRRLKEKALEVLERELEVAVARVIV